MILERRKLDNKKGFTLMEVIIVLVILAILAALLIPSLVGYIDRANENTCLVECRHFVTAAQTIAVERYADKTLEDATDGIEIKYNEFLKECFVLAELDDNGAIPDDHFAEVTVTPKGKIVSVKYTDGYYTATYTEGDFELVEGVELLANGAFVK